MAVGLCTNRDKCTEVYTGRDYPDRLWVQTAILMMALVPICIAAWSLEQRTFNGINLWIKPLKFQVSAAIHLITLFIAAALLSESFRRKWLLHVLIWASAIATIFEIAIITLRAAQGTASHFNYSTPLDGFIYGLMGIGAVTMLLPAVYLGVQVIREQSGFKGGPGLRLGIVIGFIGGAILTLAFAGYMSANGSHWTSGQLSDAAGLPLVGWSTSGGDLRPAHFFALHMMQALPMVGLIADRFCTGRPNLARSTVVLTGLLMTGASVFTFNQALDGRAFLFF